jgi:hypothetical protein
MKLGANSCAACSVWTGECPQCGTFWWVRGDGKRFGMRPATDADRAQLHEQFGTTGPHHFGQIPNAISADGGRESP